MKRKLLAMAALAAMFLGLTACSNNEDELGSLARTRGCIGFNVNADGVTATRGDATTPSNIQFTDFQAWAYDASTDALYMGNSATVGREVEYSEGSWSYSPAQFWPVNALNFVAIAPDSPNGVTGNSTASSSGVVTLTTGVTLSTNVEDQEDIMYAAGKDDTPAYGPMTKEDYGGDVPLVFQHALSQIVFKGKLPSSGAVTKVEIAEITLGNIGKTGSLTFTSAGEFFGGTNAYISTSSPDKFTLAAANLEAATWGVNLTNDGIANATAGTAFDLTDSNSANSKHNAWFMLPQRTAAWVPASDAQKKAGGLYSGSANVDPASGAYLKIRAKLSKDGIVILNNTEADAIYIPLAANWDRNKKYIYTIEFNGLAALTPITFSVTAEDWTNVERTIPEEESEPADPYYSQYFTFKAVSDCEFYCYLNGTDNVYCSLDGGSTWTLYEEYYPVSVTAGNSVLWKGEWQGRNNHFQVTYGTYEVEGNIMSLLYGDSFVGQTSLKDIDNVFYMLFNSSDGSDEGDNLLNAENLVLPATDLSNNCYAYMFQYCGALTKAPKVLPATTLAEGCYYSMFTGCSSLTTAPTLPATTLVSGCYNSMFSGCSSLNSITMLATDISAEDCLDYWVYYVSASGTFTKAASMTSLPSGDNGIPSGWNVVNQ